MVRDFWTLGAMQHISKFRNNWTFGPMQRALRPRNVVVGGSGGGGERSPVVKTFEKFGGSAALIVCA